MTADRKVAILTPVHRLVEADFLVSLHETLTKFPLPISWIHCVGHANLSRSRNYLTQEARDRGVTDLVFIDSDLGWSAEAFISLFETDARVIAGCPQRRDEKLGFCGIPDHPTIKRSGRLITGQAATAFLRVEASVFDELELKVPTYIYQDRKTPAFFQVGIQGDDLLDEDVWFSRLCRGHGIDVWLDPTIQLRHWHSQPLTEVMSDHIRYEPLKEAANV